MKKLTGIMALCATMAIALSGCAGWTTTATVGGGTGWYAGDYAPYYWSDWNGISAPPIIGNGPGSLRPAFPGGGVNPPRPQPPLQPGNPPGNTPPGAPGIGNRPTPPPQAGNGPGSNPGSPQQGGFRGQR